jgi:hypothetical protein
MRTSELRRRPADMRPSRKKSVQPDALHVRRQPLEWLALLHDEGVEVLPAQFEVGAIVEVAATMLGRSIICIMIVVFWCEEW